MQNIDRMTELEKVQAMERLWQSLTSNHSLPELPEWHQTELRKRTARIQEGKVSYSSLNKLKERGAQG